VIPRPLPGRDDEEFWAHLAAGEIRIQRCQDCGQWRYPPSPVCARCLSVAVQWQPVTGTGELLGWATFHRRYFSELDPPYTVVAVALAEGPVMCGDLRGPAPAELRLGLPMRAVIESAVLTDGQEYSIFGWQVAEPGKGGTS
jgi:hypothetical protein